MAARVVLSHALLQEGRDFDAAERALRDVLAREPQNAEARQNFGMLLRNRWSAADRVFSRAAIEPSAR
jgi:Flp pilus assembly protein TadD